MGLSMARNVNNSCRNFPGPFLWEIILCRIIKSLHYCGQWVLGKSLYSLNHQGKHVTNKHFPRADQHHSG